MRIRTWMTLALTALAVALCGAPHTLAQEIRGDMLSFMDCELPTEQYVWTHFEKRQTAEEPWQSGNAKPQCFRSMVNYTGRQIYWRKDNPSPQATYYGEIFTFDAKTIYLHAETFPPRTSVEVNDGVWDERPDRFRCFAVADAPDWSVGRAIAPVDGSTTWSHKGYINTYICNSFDEYNQQTAQIFQHRFYDNHVFVERYGPFSTVFDGTCDGWEADEEFKAFDEVIVINQCMENDTGRERFFVGRRGDLHYGIIRWDNSLMRDGQWVVIERCVGLKRGHTEDGKPFAFYGMFERAPPGPSLRTVRLSKGLTPHDKMETGGFQTALESTRFLLLEE